MLKEKLKNSGSWRGISSLGSDGGPPDKQPMSWVRAKDLRPGDKIQLANGGTATVEKVTADRELSSVYNFAVDTDHTYFVGTAGLLAHNACFPEVESNRPQDGRVFPSVDEYFGSGEAGGRGVLLPEPSLSYVPPEDADAIWDGLIDDLFDADFDDRPSVIRVRLSDEEFLGISEDDFIPGGQDTTIIIYMHQRNYETVHYEETTYTFIEQFVDARPQSNAVRDIVEQGIRALANPNFMFLDEPSGPPSEVSDFPDPNTDPYDRVDPPRRGNRSGSGAPGGTVGSAAGRAADEAVGAGIRGGDDLSRLSLREVTDRFTRADDPAVRRELAEEIARRSTRGEGDHVVLGRHPVYIDAAQATRGRWFETERNWFSLLDDAPNGMTPAELAWEVNEAFLRRHMEEGVERIVFMRESGDDYVEASMDVLQRRFPNTFTYREIEYLRETAHRYGYRATESGYVRD